MNEHLCAHSQLPFSGKNTIHQQKVRTILKNPQNEQTALRVKEEESDQLLFFSLKAVTETTVLVISGERERGSTIHVPGAVPKVKLHLFWEKEKIAATAAVATAPVNCWRVLTKAFLSEIWLDDDAFKLQVIRLL